MVAPRWLLAAAITAAIAGPARADAGGDVVATTQAHWDNMEYEAVLQSSEQALAGPGLDVKQRVELLRLEGFALVVLERNDDAVKAFQQLFALAPNYQPPPHTPGRLLRVFGSARADWLVREEQRLQTESGAALRALVLHVQLPPSPRGGRPVEIGVDLVDPTALADRVVLAQRRHGVAYYTTRELPAHGGRLAFTISGEDSASPVPYTLELHVLARHRSGVVLRREGSEEQPLALAVAAGEVPQPPPITHRWWFWTGVVAVAVVGGFLIDRAISVGPQEVVAR
jgi:hypothetical protein